MPITRFAPSPTGRLHLGHVYSAWYARERAEGRAFLLRIEDIDRERSRSEYVEGIYEDLRWLGLDWDGEVWFQSERESAYQDALVRLKEAGVVYPCFCTRKEIQEEIARMGNAPHGPDGALYPGTCRSLGLKEALDRANSGEPHVWRLDLGAALARTGPVSFLEKGVRVLGQPELFGDVVLARRDAGSAYHLCVVVDDAAQGVELVTRGEDLREATGVHRVLQELLGLPEPAYDHHGLVVDEEGKRLAKRADSVSIRVLRERGMSAREVLEWAVSRVAESPPLLPGEGAGG